MSKEISKDYARETIDKAVDVFVDLIWKKAKSKAESIQKDSESITDSIIKDSKAVITLLTLILESALYTSNTFESDFFTKLGKGDSSSQSLFLSNEMILPIVRALALIKIPDERKEIAKKLAEQIYNRIEKIWLENNLTFHELIILIESYADIAKVANLASNSECKNFIVRVCDSFSQYKPQENANASKFKILYWAFADSIPDTFIRHTFCDALDEHYSK